MHCITAHGATHVLKSAAHVPMSSPAVAKDGPKDKQYLPILIYKWHCETLFKSEEHEGLFQS